MPNKFREKYIKNQREGTFQNHRRRAGVGPPVTEAATRRDLWGGRLGDWWPPWCSPLAPIYSPVAKTLIPDPFSPEAIPITAAIADNLRGTRIPVPAPCRDGEVPPGFISITVASLLHEAGVVPPRG